MNKVANANISVVRVRDVLMVTMPADPDDGTVSMFQAKVLEALDHYQSKGLILDIALVETLDSFFARVIAETAQMVALMGARMIVAGMRPSVAITATQLGLSLGRATATLNVDRALDLLLSSPTRE